MATSIKDFSIDRLLGKVDEMGIQLASTKDPASRKDLRNKQRRLGEVIYEKAEEQLAEVTEMYESGVAPESYYLEACDKLEPYLQIGEVLAQPWMEVAEGAKGFIVTMNEVSSLTNWMYRGVMSKPVQTALNISERKWINSRLKRYPILYPDAISPVQLTSKPYTLQEVTEKFPQFKTEFAKKWQEKGLSTRAKIYFYKDKPVMGIFYTLDRSDTKKQDINIETIILDSKFKKHDDFYSAVMATGVQVSYPATKRTLELLRKKWDALMKKEKKEFKEDVCEMEIYGELDDHFALVEEAVEHEALNEDEASFYKEEMLHLAYGK